VTVHFSYEGALPEKVNKMSLLSGAVKVENGWLQGVSVCFS
jgi:hypothetical protein